MAIKNLFTDQLFFENKTLLDVGNILITAVVMLIVSIPEGLPLAVSIAMAMSIKELKKDEIIVKNLESVQSCAQLNDLFVGKTGTLTKGDLNVKVLQISGEEELEKRDAQDNLLMNAKKSLGNYGQSTVDDIA